MDMADAKMKTGFYVFCRMLKCWLLAHNAISIKLLPKMDKNIYQLKLNAILLK